MPMARLSQWTVPLEVHICFPLSYHRMTFGGMTPHTCSSKMQWSDSVNISEYMTSSQERKLPQVHTALTASTVNFLLLKL